MSEILLPIGPALQSAIRGIESIAELTAAPWKADWNGEDLVFGRNAQLPEDLLSLWDSKQLDSLHTLARQIWSSAAEQNRPTVWCLRNHPLDASVILLLCAVPNIALSSLMNLELTDDEICRLMTVLNGLTHSPLSISRTPDAVSFGEQLALARLVQGAEVAVCDWPLSPDEAGIALRSGIHVLAPREPAGE